MGLSAADFVPKAVATGDFNADGRDDIAIAVDDIGSFPVRGVVLVYLNIGDEFADPVSYTLPGLFPQCLEALDVTADGALDLVVCHARSIGGGNIEGLITVLGGQRTGNAANGTFQQIFSGAVGTEPATAASGDIDGDGRTDLVTVDTANERVLILYGSAGANRFEPAIELAEVQRAVAALVHHLPGQPLAQVLVAAAPSDLLRFRQTAARQFAAPIEQDIAFVPMAMALGEIDDNALDDLVVVSAQGADLFYGLADGSFDFGESISTDNDLDALTLADLNGDGRLDMAASASTVDHVTVALNGADVPSTPAPTPTITATPMHTATATRTPTGGLGCAGDCDGSNGVSISELIRGVNIALNNAAAGTCPAFDLDGNGQVAINELIAAVNASLDGC